MPDREKVIKGLEFTKAMITFNPSTGEDIEPGNLNEADKTTYDACVGALALLKDQEPVEPTISSIEDHAGHASWWYQCGKCEMPIDYGDRFCRHCGQAVKWERKSAIARNANVTSVENGAIITSRRLITQLE